MGYRYKWHYDKNEHPQSCCYDCRIKYGEFPDMVIPDKLWKKISPTGDDGGILCPTCIANRLNHLQLWYANDLYILHLKTEQTNMQDI
jgi:hypothetical protein